MMVDQLIIEYRKPYLWRQLGILMELAELWERHEIRAQQDKIRADCLTWGGLETHSSSRLAQRIEPCYTIATNSSTR